MAADSSPYPPAVRHPIFARVQARLAARMEDAGVAAHRIEALTGLAGRVVEVGAGSGVNFQHYPTSVTELVAIEPEAYLRRQAQAAAERAPIPVTVVDGVAEALPAADGAFDAAVAALVLCSVSDQARALAELRRVIRPGGELRFYEHVRAQDPRLAGLQRRLDHWLWPRVAGGCHTSRDTAAAIGVAGFEIDRCRRFTFKPVALAAPTSPMILGTARRPDRPAA